MLYTQSQKNRNMGIGYQLGLHSLNVAKEHDFLAIQFNAVVSTNIASNKLWIKLGFQKIGEIPGAFKVLMAILNQQISILKNFSTFQATVSSFWYPPFMAS